MQSKHIYTAITVASMFIAGCATHEHKINSAETSANVASGTLVHGNPGTPDRLLIEAAGKHFEGELAIKKHVNWEKVRKAYGSDSRHWQKIISGQDKDHQTSVGTAEIKSTDGETMQCKLVWTRAERPEGECIDSKGVSLELNFH